MGMAAMPGLDGEGPDVRVVEDGDRCIVRLAGEIDLLNGPAVEHILRELLDGRDGPVVVDLSAVEFIDSSGLHALLVARHHHPGRVVLGATSERVDRLLEITGTRELFT